MKLGVVFTQLSDGLLAANPVPPEKVHITRVNAMGKHDKLADITLSGDDLAPSNTVHDLKELLYSRLFMSRRFKLALYFWGKELEDETKTLFDYKVITDSQLTLASVERSHAELAAIREQTPLRSLRIASNKVVPFTIDGIEPSLTAGELRRAIHSHLHTPITYLAIQNWNKEADTLIYKRGDQVRVPARPRHTLCHRARLIPAHCPPCPPRPIPATPSHTRATNRSPRHAARKGGRRRRRQEEGQEWRHAHAKSARWLCR